MYTFRAPPFVSLCVQETSVYILYINLPHVHNDYILASFPGFPSSFPSLAVRGKRFSRTASDGKLEGKPGNEASYIHVQCTKVTLFY